MDFQEIMRMKYHEMTKSFTHDVYISKQIEMKLHIRLLGFIYQITISLQLKLTKEKYVIHIIHFKNQHYIRHTVMKLTKYQSCGQSIILTGYSFARKTNVRILCGYVYLFKDWLW